ncbi:hypothetical protein NLU13_5391 [Sarocladium strictum]|uniref:Uncharacterized protein n=1 Tax=Sarocladium strictum TaxID=5046 RepID=A0AA39L7K7_SARSR|nr:hypothetical protein NLU13_5391 [Sarocladium strictum]
MLFSKSAAGLLVAACSSLAAPGKPIKKDVLVIGGGASGAHAAVRLRDDYGLSVALIEKQDILGGHVNSYTDPETGDVYNYGVQTFVETGNATGFVNRFGIETMAPPRVPLTTQYIDFETATKLSYTGPTSAEQRAALEIYLALCEKYEHMLYPGYWEFPEPEDIPEELLMNFGDFAKKHGMEAAVPIIWRVGAMGLGDATKHMTFYVMQTFGAPLTRNFLGLATSWIPASGRSQDLYDAIDKHLGKDVYRSSTVVNAKRRKCGVHATVKNHKTGRTTEIHARALVIAIEPTASNLRPFHPDEEELAVFSKFSYTNIWAGILANEALPVGGSLTNMAPGVEQPKPANWLSYPDLPFSVRFDYMGAEKLFRIMIQGEGGMTDASARDLIQADFERMIDAGLLPEPTSRKIEYVAWEAHGPMHARASRSDIEQGFIQQQYALLGRHSTWYTGGAFSMNFQTSLWEYNDVMLPKLVESLKG